MKVKNPVDIAPISLACDTNLLVGRLKHSWLENQIINKSVSDIIELRREGPWSELDLQFISNVYEAASLADNLIDGFSPRQLVDRLHSLQHLDQDKRNRLKDCVHELYVKQSSLAEGARQLAKTVRALAVALDDLRSLWRLGSDSDLTLAWQRVLQEANVLVRNLQGLPKRIVLP